MSTSHSPGAPSRRRFLAAGAAFGGALLAGPRRSISQGAAPVLEVGTRTIEVNKKAATVYRVTGTGGRSGILASEGERLKGALLNASDEPLQLHWHGQVKAPFDQDRARPDGGMLAVGERDSHDFELTPGTHWMHSHTLSEQQLLAAPMVTRERDAGDVQDVIVMLHDFAFRTPQEILAELGGTDAHAGHGAPAAPRQASEPSGHGGHHGHHGHHGAGHGHKAGMVHANDVNYDAYLANDRTLDDPETVRVERGGRVRLRIINGGTATAFIVSTPGLPSRCIAVDGTQCRPHAAARYPLAQGQRIDLMVQIPKGGGAFPMLAQVEDSQFRTGIVLATAGAAVARIGTSAARKAGMVDLSLDAALRAARSLPARKPDRTYTTMLGEEPGYRWTINGRIHGEHQPYEVRLGERVEMTFVNPTTMMHPMHLHGHHFQVVAIGRRRFAGPLRDTVVVPAHQPVTIAFDAGHKGAWYLHCHHLYHMATGMMTEVRVV